MELWRQGKPPPPTPLPPFLNVYTNNNTQAEFSYKVKPKLPQQFKAAEQAGVPFAVILGEDELAAGKVRVKEMGLEDGHPEKEGVLVDLTALPAEVKARVAKKRGGSVEGVAQQLGEMKVDA